MRSQSTQFPLALLAALGIACSGGSEEKSPDDTNQKQNTGPVTLQGAVQKGPFITGSSVQVSMLDASGNPTGAVFNTTTRNDIGEFELSLPNTGTAELTTSGFYFNEVSGQLSKSQISMRALASFTASGTQSVYVNALTQMTYLRAKKLIKDGTPFADALKQAEDELKNSFGLPTRENMSTGTEMNLLGGDTDDNAYLFAMSCVLAQAAVNEAPEAVDAKLQELINAVALDLESDGTVGDGLKEKIAGGIRTINPLLCTANMKKRLADTGSSATLPNIFKALDFDGDGITDFLDDDDDGDGVPEEEDVIASVESDSNYHYAIDADGQVWSWLNYGELRKSPAQLPFNTPISSLLVLPNGGFAAITTDGAVFTRPYGDAEIVKVSGLENVTGITTTSTSMDNFFVVKSDGTAWKFSASSPSATQIEGLSDLRFLAGDPTDLMGLAFVKNDGTVWTARGGSPDFVQVSGLSNVTKLVGISWYSAGFAALTDDGGLWTWTFEGESVPAKKVADHVAMVTQDAAYYVKDDGTVWNFNQGQQETSLSDVAAVSGHAAVVLLRDGTIKTDGELIHIPR